MASKEKAIASCAHIKTKDYEPGRLCTDEPTFLGSNCGRGNVECARFAVSGAIRCRAPLDQRHERFGMQSDNVADVAYIIEPGRISRHVGM